MRTILFVLRVEARSRWRTWLGLAVLAGMGGGATIAVLAGARRTDTAYPRFLEGTRAFDVLATNGGNTSKNTNRHFDFHELAGLPMVADAAQVNYYFREAGRRRDGHWRPTTSLPSRASTAVSAPS